MPSILNFRSVLTLASVVWAGCVMPAGERSGDLSAPEASAAQTETRTPFPKDQMLSLLTLDGAPVTVPDERSRPTLLLATKDARASGMAGVNRFSGTYTQEGSALKFSPLMATKMAGAPELNELETRYLRMLGQVTGWRVRNETLELLAGEQVLAGFVRKP